jgi:acetyl esterase/lipase
MTKLMTIIGFLLIAGGLGFHFGALEIFNGLVPKDASSKRIAQNVAYGSDKRQVLDVFAPRDGKGPWPVVVFVHGGSWESGNKNGYEFAGRAIAAQGFVAMVMNYRLHPKAKYPAFVQDVTSALAWAKNSAAQYGGDGEKLFAMGHSAGAYNIAQAILSPAFAEGRPVLKGVVTMAGPFDFLPLDTKTTKKVFGSLPDLPATQPVNFARSDAPPFLILHGTADTTVFLKNARNLHAALAAKGVDSTLKFYDGISHAGLVLSLSTWRRKSAPALADAAAFMKDRAQ